jgi:hypothetical protein
VTEWYKNVQLVSLRVLRHNMQSVHLFLAGVLPKLIQVLYVKVNLVVQRVQCFQLFSLNSLPELVTNNIFLRNCIHLLGEFCTPGKHAKTSGVKSAE